MRHISSALLLEELIILVVWAGDAEHNRFIVKSDFGNPGIQKINPGKACWY